MCPAKTGEPIEMPFGRLTHVGPRNHVLDRGQDRTNPYAAAMGDKLAMSPSYFGQSYLSRFLFKVISAKLTCFVTDSTPMTVDLLLELFLIS